ncbi:hypothetical protein IPJ72_03330 [Candidatus Peregrinibacteria bacterium]|nr:MAG: hypothetical protein IPJ72_03330 [Candidatus Peregrinibacteria bacterium]
MFPTFPLGKNALWNLRAFSLPTSSVELRLQAFFRLVYESFSATECTQFKQAFSNIPEVLRPEIVRLFELFYFDRSLLERFYEVTRAMDEDALSTFIPLFTARVQDHFLWYEKLPERIKRDYMNASREFTHLELGSFVSLDFPPDEIFDPQALFKRLIASASAPLTQPDVPIEPCKPLTFLPILLKSIRPYMGSDDRIHPIVPRGLRALSDRCFDFGGFHGDPSIISIIDAGLEFPYPQQFGPDDYRMFCETVQQEIEPFDPDHARHVIDRLPLQLQDRNTTFIRVHLDGKPAGMCRVQAKGDGETYEIGTLYVAKAFRTLLPGAFLQLAASAYLPWNAKKIAITSTRTPAMFRHIEGHAVATRFDFTDDAAGKSAELFYLENYDPNCYSTKDVKKFPPDSVVAMADRAHGSFEAGDDIVARTFDARVGHNQPFIDFTRLAFDAGYHVTRCFPEQPNNLSKIYVIYERPSNTAPRSDTED